MRRAFWCYQKQVHNVVLIETLQTITCNKSHEPDVFNTIYFTAILMTLPSVGFMYHYMMCRFVCTSLYLFFAGVSAAVNKWRYFWTHRSASGGPGPQSGSFTSNYRYQGKATHGMETRNHAR